MSYILDALRRADSERERSAVPGLNSQQVPPSSLQGRAAGRVKPWVWVVLGVAVVVAAQVAWRMLTAEPASELPPASVAQAPPLPEAAAPAPRAAVPETAGPAIPEAPSHFTPPPVADAGAPAAATRRPPAAGPANAGAATAPAVTPPPVAAAPAHTATSPAPAPAPGLTPAPVVPSTTAPAPAAAFAAAAPAEPRILAVNELPADVRRTLPPVQFGGSVYSQDPATRILIINGQVLHEGDQPADGLVLERIEPKAAVFNFKGTRYRAAF